MRVLHLGKYLPPHPGGIERFLAELLPVQRQLGVRTAALVHAEPNMLGAACRRQADALVVRARVRGRLAYTPISPAWPFQLNRMIQHWQPDLLHLHLPNPSAFWALALPAARRLPWLVHWHADVPADALDWRLRLFYRGYRPLENAVLRRARQIVATSQAYAQSSLPLQRWRDKVEVVPLGLPDVTAATPTPRLWPKPELLRILFVGRFSYYKGLHHLVDAMRTLDHASLVLVGAGERENELRRQVELAGLTGRICFAGALDDAALAGAYAAAQVLCLPSIERSEAFGLVLLEAMRAGVATVASSVPGSGMSEVLGHGATGVLVAPGDVSALAAALSDLGASPERRAQLAVSGQQRFQSHYRLDRVAEQLNGVYRSMLESQHRSGHR